MKYRILQQLLKVLTCLLLLLSIAINRNHKLFGYELNRTYRNQQPTKNITNDGTMIISTYELGNDVMGYGGKTPLQIYIKEGIIQDIVFLSNSETPEFFHEVGNSPDILRLIGLTIDEAIDIPIDAITGATLSSNAVIENIKRGLHFAHNTGSMHEKYNKNISIKTICAIIVILMGCIIPFLLKSNRYRIYQLILNVIVLGFWTGSFISYSLMINYLSNGINIWISIVPILLLIIAFILPIFTKRGHYCGWICPLGSLQEIAGHCVKTKWKMPVGLLTYLSYFRDVLWALLMIIMFCGVTFNWMDYELFSAFIFQQASTIVIVITIVFILLSCIITRPYCRFVCPTGNLFKISLKNK